MGPSVVVVITRTAMRAAPSLAARRLWRMGAALYALSSMEQRQSPFLRAGLLLSVAVARPGSPLS